MLKKLCYFLSRKVQILSTFIQLEDASKFISIWMTWTVRGQRWKIPKFSYISSIKDRLVYDVFLKTLICKTWRHQQSCGSHPFIEVQNWLILRLCELVPNGLLKANWKVQIHEIVLILKLHIFEICMAICPQKYNKNKQYRLSDTNIFCE